MARKLLTRLVGALQTYVTWRACCYCWCETVVASDAIGIERLLDFPLVDFQDLQRSIPELHESGLEAALVAVEDLLHVSGSESVERLLEALDKLSSGQQTYPLLRRLSVLAAVRGGLLEEPGAGQLVARLWQKLQDLYKRGKKAKVAQQLLHVMKSGGSTLCEVAKHSGQSVGQGPCCTMRGFSDHSISFPWGEVNYQNITRPALERAVQQGKYWRPTCGERAQKLAGSSIDFIAMEHTLPFADGSREAAVCPQLLNWLMVREPLARALSHYAWLKNSHMFNDGKLPFPEAFEEVSQLTPAIADNFLLRNLLGEDVYIAPYGNLTEAHLNQGKLLLAQMDLVVVLEEPRQSNVVLQQALGWDVDLTKMVKNHNQGGNNADWLEHHGAFLLQAAQHSYLDIHLYSIARRLAQLDYLLFAPLSLPVSRHQADAPVHVLTPGAGQAPPTRAPLILESRVHSTAAADQW